VTGPANGADQLIHDAAVHTDPLVFGALSNERHRDRIPRRGDRRADDRRQRTCMALRRRSSTRRLSNDLM